MSFSVNINIAPHNARGNAANVFKCYSVTPPSTLRTVPVIKLASSDAKKA